MLRAEPANSLVGAALRALDLDRTGPVIYLLERSRRLQPDVRGSNWDLSLTERVFVPNQRIEALRGLRKEQVMDDHASSPRRRSGGRRGDAPNRSTAPRTVPVARSISALISEQ
ncbi:hypothetical protein BJD99_06575 [Rhodococcus sp. 1163]|nr:hypothetical protein BJD99_06575 [Rhodococcus sp. 1163]